MKVRIAALSFSVCVLKSSRGDLTCSGVISKLSHRLCAPCFAGGQVSESPDSDSELVASPRNSSTTVADVGLCVVYGLMYG